MGLFLPVTRNGKTETVQGVALIDPATGEPGGGMSATIDAGTKVTAVAPLGAGGSGLIGWLSQSVDWLSQTFAAIFAMSAKLPASLGAKTGANSLSVAPASDGVWQVSGTAAAGTAPSAPPLSISGVDSGGLKRHLATDQSGNIATFSAATRAAAPAVIPINAAQSSVIDLTSTALLGFVMPSTWTAGGILIEVSPDNFATTPVSLLDGSGTAISSWASATAGAAYSVDVAAMLPWRYIRFKSSVNQAAARTITVVTRPLA